MRLRTTGARRRGRSSRTALGKATAGALVALGCVILFAVLIAPQFAERTYGNVKTSVTGTVNDVRERTFGDLPTVDLGVTGHVAELDKCDGTFTQMSAYERDGVPPVWAAHNNCSGDAVLPWETGQLVRVSGSDQVYEVVEVRHTPKTYATTSDLVGLQGSFALQTCFYGEDRMKFVGLKPIDEPQD